jgi:nuclear GTP-binding protein
LSPSQRACSASWWLLAQLQQTYLLLLLPLQDLQSKDLPTTRIQPDRRWFGNTRVIGQKQLEQFREEMSSKINDSYTVLLREKKLPLQLLEDPERKVGGKQKRVDLLSTQPFGETFGPNRKRKRPKLAVEGYDDLVQAAAAKEEK